MIRHNQIIVHGRVQGVFYRRHTLQKAIELGIKGFVQNKDDGAVYIEAEGTIDQLKKLIEWCKQGPDAAKVDKIEVKEDSIKQYHDFIIKY
ncbi:acylphosphatase [Candidatus Woesearchaeota archaeon]|nr:acylphosphatase [Candidatus Woesearchaeota archaeon]